MKQFVISVIACLATATMAHAQTFTDHVQKNNNGDGKVKVTQSKEIDELVNGGRKPAASTTTAKPATSNPPATTTTKPQDTGTVKKQDTPVATQSHTAEPVKTTPAETPRRTETRTTTRPSSSTSSTATTATTPAGKKVARGGRKITGYRVQVYAGGNTRNDKVKATEAGNAMKRKYPNLPVYVHFYSPRWICRIGNFVNENDAQATLKQVKAMGYKSATIVKGKILVH